MHNEIYDFIKVIIKNVLGNRREYIISSNNASCLKFYDKALRKHISFLLFRYIYKSA